VRSPFLAFISLLVAGATTACYDPNKVSAPDEVLLLTAAPVTIPADGFSTAKITARVTTASTRPITIAFSTSGGSLSPAAERTPDGAGEASVFLKSDATPKTVSVTAEVKDGASVLVSRSVTVTFDVASADSVLRLSTSSNQIEADGVSSVQLRAESNPAGANRMVTFTTTDGSFTRGATPPVNELQNVATGADGVARAQLFAPDTAGTALVTATANQFSASQTITFTPALPDFITLSADPLEVSNLSEANKTDLVAVLSRPIGTVTRNTRVEFTVVNDASGQSFGRFQNITRSDASETVKAQFVPGTAAPLGLATITARVPGTNVTAQVKVNITN